MTEADRQPAQRSLPLVGPGKLWIAAVVCAALAVAVIVQSRSLTSPLSALERAQQAIDRGRSLEAQRILRDHLTRHPGEQQPRLLLAEIQADRAPLQAIKTLREIPTDSATYVAALRRIAELAATNGLAEVHETALRQLVARDENDVQSLVALTRLLLRTQRAREAWPLLQHALTIEPERVETLVLYAEVLDDLGRTTEMVAPLEQALAVEPQHLAARANLAYAYREAGRLEDAERFARQCLAEVPTLHTVRVVLAQALYDTGRHDEAMTEVQRVLDHAPGMLAARLREADILMFRREPEAAYERLRPLRDKHPDSRPLVSHLARAAQAAGYTDEARKLRAELQKMIAEAQARRTGG